MQNDDEHYKDEARLINTINECINQKTESNKDDPFYIVDLNKVVSQYQNWCTKLPNIKPYFAMKANPNPKIIKTLADLGCNFDCASKSELSTILDLVNDPSRIIYANPCKMASHITYARENEINLMTFDCIEELYKIKDTHSNAELLLRLSVDDSDSICKFNSKFGCSMDDVELVLQTIIELELNLVGFSFHVGSGCQNARNYYKAIQDCKLATVLASHYGICIKMIDIGGGFPGSNMRDFDDICENILRAKRKFFKKNITFIAEPGRYFTESTHTLVVNVIAKKRERDVIKYYLNDGVYGSFNCLHFDHQMPVLKVLPSSYAPIIAKYNSTFFGPTCDSMDIIYKDIEYQELNVGNWLYVKNFGSYTASANILGSFNGFSLTEYYYNPQNKIESVSSESSTSSSESLNF